MTKEDFEQLMTQQDDAGALLLALCPFLQSAEWDGQRLLIALAHASAVIAADVGITEEQWGDLSRAAFRDARTCDQIAARIRAVSGRLLESALPVSGPAS